MSFLSRFRRHGSAARAGRRPGRRGPAPDPAEPEASDEVAPAAPPVPEPIACPSCARLVDPPPVRTRKCPHCRRPIIVRRTDGRTVYLTEAAVEVFEAERQREADMAAWTTQRAQWLRLARGVGAPEDRRGRIAARPVSAESVADARALYLAAAAKDRKTAARMGAWDIAARIGREEAMALYREAGSPVPVPDEIAEVHANAMSALLRSLKATGTHAEIVGGVVLRRMSRATTAGRSPSPRSSASRGCRTPAAPVGSAPASGGSASRPRRSGAGGRSG